MVGKPRNQWRYKQIGMLEEYLSEWRTTPLCRDTLFDLVGTKHLPSRAELAGSLSGDRRIKSRGDGLTADSPIEWKWK